MNGHLTDINGLKKSYPLVIRSSYPFKCDRDLRYIVDDGMFCLLKQTKGKNTL